MFEQLASLKAILSNLEWVLSLGASDVKHVKEDTDKLIHDLGASLVSLWDLTTTLTIEKA